METCYDHQKSDRLRSLSGFILAALFTAILCSSPVRAQEVLISEDANIESYSYYSSSDSSLVSPCSGYSGFACLLVAAYDEGIHCCGWYSGQDNGIPNVAIFSYVNYVYDTTYRTTDGYNSGAIVVVAPLGKTYTFQGEEAQRGTPYGTCTNEAYYQQGWSVDLSSGDGYAYTLGIPFSCS